MNASALLDELWDAGVRLRRDGDDLMADVLPSADLALHTARITAHKRVLLSALQLRKRIIAVATVEPEHLDRRAHDARIAGCPCRTMLLASRGRGRFSG